MYKVEGYWQRRRSLPSIFSPRNLAVGPLFAPHYPLVILFSHFLELFDKFLDL